MSIGAAFSWRLLTTFLLNAAAITTARSTTSLLETTWPVQHDESREVYAVNVLIGEGVLENASQRFDVHVDGHVIEGAVAGFAPHHHGGRTDALAVKQNLAGGHRTGVDHFRIAGRDLADVGRIVDDDAFADRQTKVLGALRARRKSASERKPSVSIANE